LLAATRNDEELRRKEVELALVRERAERDKREREALETLQMSLEAEKRRVEDELEAERTLVLEKDALLERTTKRETQLEEDVAALQADIDVLDSQLDRAMKLQKESEEKHESLRRAFDQAAEHLVRLETEQKEWRSKETTLSSELESKSEEVETLRSDLDEMHALNEGLKNLVLQREEDVLRSKERMNSAVKELEGKLDIELRNKYNFFPQSFKFEVNDILLSGRSSRTSLIASRMMLVTLRSN
jgi:myosin protein heavy chain